jgi:hypothetical protein
MARKPYIYRTIAYGSVTAWLSLAAAGAFADERSDTQQQIQQLQEQNRQFQEQLHQQQLIIESLSRKVGQMEENNARRDEEAGARAGGVTEPEKASSGFNFGKVNISGEGGVVFFKGGKEGLFPKGDFRIDEAKLFVESHVWGDVYSYSEINLAMREDDSLRPSIGELYLDWENISKWWGMERVLNLRIGRMDIPFGEEYLTRDAIDNPLIAHSLTDFWGYDEGLELYGKVGQFSYVLAVQNGGIPETRDFDSDKSVTARFGYDPNRWLHLSVSGMRTGDLDAEKDLLSAEWFGNGFFRSIGTTNTTKFHADAVQGDVLIALPHGHISGFGGYAKYGDNDTAQNNRREVYYYSIEGVQAVTKKLYAAARFSQIFAHKGFPISGHGDMGAYYWNPFALTENIWRLTLGLGYQWSPNLLTKVDYSFEGGKEVSGEHRDKEDLFAVEAAFKF